MNLSELKLQFVHLKIQILGHTGHFSKAFMPPYAKDTICGNEDMEQNILDSSVLNACCASLFDLYSP
jgi:hypothetical protein